MFKDKNMSKKKGCLITYSQIVFQIRYPQKEEGSLKRTGV